MELKSTDSGIKKNVRQEMAIIFGKFSSLEVGKCFEKLRSLEAWKFGVFKKWLLQHFVSVSNDAPYINLLRAKRHKFLVPYCPTVLLPQRIAFTMAEILISLTIIGVIAAITLPALQANINESAWKAQRKALYSRMSQAIALMPSLNGYGEFTGDWADGIVTPTKDNAAEKFVTDGLAKVLNINNICSIPMSTTNTTDRHKELAKCSTPDSVTVMGTNSKIPFPTKLSEFNPMFTSTYTIPGGTYCNPQKYIDTNAAAFETKNGESIAIFYNPYCQPDRGETDWYFPQPKMCANFIYDLNGKKGPNKVGKDIGFITALYPTDSEIIAPMPLEKNINNNVAKQVNAAAACHKQDKNSRLPNREELMAMFYNQQLLNMSSELYWSGTVLSSDNSKAWRLAFFAAGVLYPFDRKESNYIRCIKR